MFDISGFPIVTAWLCVKHEPLMQSPTVIAVLGNDPSCVLVSVTANLGQVTMR